jgi:integrase
MTRRGNGEGTIVHSGGRWVAALTLDTGKRRFLYGKTRAEAAQKLAAAQRDRDKGLPVLGERQTVAQYLASWLDAARPTIRPQSWRRYEETARLHIIPTIGKIKLTKLTAQHIQGLYAAKLNAGQSTATVRYMHVTLRRALSEAERLDLVPRNVARLVKPPRKERPEMHVLDADQARRFLGAVAGHRLEALFTLAVTSGMRSGEMLGLRWGDVDLDGRSLQVKFSLKRLDGKLVLKEVKTEHSRRHIALTEAAVAGLRAHRRHQHEERLFLGPAWQDRDLVFCMKDGNPMDGIHLLRYQFKPLMRSAGLPEEVVFHDLRHTAATLMLLQGIHPKVVSEMLGHASIAITLDLYSHVLPNMQRDATAAMDRLLGTA